jgi:predicted TIM-barrel fold metal-dependent hydrolase
MKRDIHHHFVPEIVKQYVDDVPEWNVEKSLAYLKRQGMDKANLSLSNYDISFAAKAEYVQFCSQVNRELSDIVTKYPEHFDAFGVLPFPHINESIEELYRCLDVYRFSGVTLYTNYGGTYPSFHEHKELFSIFNKRGVKLFIHPATTPPINGEKYDAISGFIEYPQEVTRLVSRFLVEDGFEKYPNISYVLSHGGGTLSYLFDRIGKIPYLKCPQGVLKIHWGRLIGDLMKKRNRILEDIESMEFDLCGFTGTEQLAALQTNVAKERCLFGSNYPYLDG